MNTLVYFILIAVAIFVVCKVLSKFKIPKLNSLVLIDGGVKCGKSTCSVSFAYSTYKSNVRKVKFSNFFRRIFKKPLLELPLLYSNVPLACPYVEVTREMLLRETKVVPRSVVYLQEASLVADSQLIKDKHINNQLLLFFKLFGHESKGGTCILDTQSISDLHYAIKRSLSEYFYIHHLTKWIPFVIIAHMVEDRYSDDGTVVTASTQDTEDTLKKVFISKKTWKRFDCYCYSVLTDDLPAEKKVINNNLQTKDLKAHHIVSFRPEFNIKKELENEKKND